MSDCFHRCFVRFRKYFVFEILLQQVLGFKFKAKIFFVIKSEADPVKNPQNKILGCKPSALLYTKFTLPDPLNNWNKAENWGKQNRYGYLQRPKNAFVTIHQNEAINGPCKVLPWEIYTAPIGTHGVYCFLWVFWSC